MTTHPKLAPLLAAFAVGAAISFLTAASSPQLQLLNLVHASPFSFHGLPPADPLARKFKTHPAPVFNFNGRYYELCDSPVIREALGHIANLSERILARHDWAMSTEPLSYLNQRLNQYRGLPKSKGRNATRFPEYQWAKEWSGLDYNHERFDLMGPVVFPCKLASYGARVSQTTHRTREDQMKRLCHTLEFERPGCSVFSIGSDNQWAFERDIAARTPCDIYVFDCTLDVHIPPELQSRVRFFKVCLALEAFTDPGTGRVFKTWQDLYALAQVSRASLLKFNIEGLEWQVLAGIVHSAASAPDLFPEQIAVELHTLTQMRELSWHGRDKSPGEIFSLLNFLFYRGGYVLADRRDDLDCRHCSELVLVKALCI